MNQVNHNTPSKSENMTSGRTLASRLLDLPRAVLTFFLLVLPVTAFPQADKILSDARGHVATAMQIGFWILLGAGYAVAGYMVISGAIRIFQDREGGVGRFALGILVAVVTVVLMTLFITEGQKQIDLISGSTKP